METVGQEIEKVGTCWGKKAFVEQIEKVRKKLVKT